MPAGALLRRARKRAGMTLHDLARPVGVSPSTLSRAETGRAGSRLSGFADAMGIDLAGLQRLDGDEVAMALVARRIYEPGERGGVAAVRRPGPLAADAGRP